MKIAKISAMTAALAMAAAPVAIQAAPGSARTAAPVEGESEIAGFGATAVILAIGAIGIGALLLTEDDEDEPVSP